MMIPSLHPCREASGGSAGRNVIYFTFAEQPYSSSKARSRRIGRDEGASRRPAVTHLSDSIWPNPARPARAGHPSSRAGRKKNCIDPSPTHLAAEQSSAGCEAEAFYLVFRDRCDGAIAQANEFDRACFGAVDNGLSDQRGDRISPIHQ